MATNIDATTEDPVFYVQPMWRLYNEGQLDKPVSRQLWVGGWSQWLAVLNCIVSSQYPATTSEQTEDFMCNVVVVIYRVCKSVRLSVICSYKLWAFNKSNYQSKPCVKSLTRDNVFRNKVLWLFNASQFSLQSEWYGHVLRMNKHRIPNKVLNVNLKANVDEEEWNQDGNNR
jgi:hypothetical protein